MRQRRKWVPSEERPAIAKRISEDDYPLQGEKQIMLSIRIKNTYVPYYLLTLACDIKAIIAVLERA